MNIFIHELKANFKSLIIWCVIAGLFTIVGAAKFSAYANNPEMLKVLDTFPKVMLDALELKAFNLTTVTGFYGIMFVYFGLMAAIAAGLWGSDIISKEERDKTVEFSLVLPVSRSKVITAKALAALVNSIVFVLLTWAISLLAARAYTPDPGFYGFLRTEMVAMVLIAVIYLAIGLMLGAVMKQYRRSGTIVVAVVLVTYFFSIITVMQKNLDFLKYFSPFKYFDAATFVTSHQLDSTFVLLTFGIIVVCMVVAYLGYNRRDLYI
jgi:beta-exotoxin I transport system permease protein